MPNSEFINIEDLVFNKSFRNWVLFQNNEDSEFWQKWVAAHPEKGELINHAKAIIYALQCNLKELSEKDINAEIEKVLKKLHANSYDNIIGLEGFNKNTAFRRLFLSTAIAASTCGMIFLLIYLFNTKQVINPDKSRDIVYETFITKNKAGVTENFKKDTAQYIQLSDGSTVFLKANSKLTYADNFVGSKREVYLTGEAFFKIKRDPSHPFIVYTNSITAKVLGTSFWVKAYSSEKQAIVTVKTGKVSVYRSSSFVDSKDHLLSGIVVTPNQALLYNKEDNELRKTVIEQPFLLKEKLVKNLFTFQATPISSVFKSMQEAYGISIVYDEDTMAGCSLSARLGDESFFDKLNIICKAINASYEMIDGNIIIASKGCK